MQLTPRSVYRDRVFLALGLLLLFLAPGYETTAPAVPPVASARLNSVEFIAPGTVVDSTAPRGWTHLILKSQPHLPESQRKLVIERTAQLATMLFPTTLAQVSSDGEGKDRRYRLARLGVGVCVKVGGQDMVVSPDTQARLGANLDLSGRILLSSVYDKQKEIRLVASSPTGVVMDTPVFMPKGRGHAAAVIRYVFLVDPLTGRLDTLLWRIDRDDRGRYEGATGSIEWLPPNKLVTASLQVDLNEFTLGIPSERAFAVVNIPDGKKKFAIPASCQTEAGLATLTGEQARKLDSTLREMIRPR